jgi:hypothetical protein
MKPRQLVKKAAMVFLVAFVLNALWEHAHALLYIHYRGGEITNLILLRAAFFDALITAAIITPAFLYGWFRDRSWYIILVGILFAIALEWWALGTGRWAYNVYMPIVPFFSVGITPTVQLGLLGYISYRITLRFGS